jgi:hypothetical protein
MNLYFWWLSCKRFQQAQAMYETSFEIKWYDIYERNESEISKKYVGKRFSLYTEKLTLFISIWPVPLSLK